MKNINLFAILLVMFLVGACKPAEVPKDENVKETETEKVEAVDAGAAEAEADAGTVEETDAAEEKAEKGKSEEAKEKAQPAKAAE